MSVDESREQCCVMSRRRHFSVISRPWLLIGCRLIGQKLNRRLICRSKCVLRLNNFPSRNSHFPSACRDKISRVPKRRPGEEKCARRSLFLCALIERLNNLCMGEWKPIVGTPDRDKRLNKSTHRRRKYDKRDSIEFSSVRWPSRRLNSFRVTFSGAARWKPKPRQADQIEWHGACQCRNAIRITIGRFDSAENRHRQKSENCNFKL